MTSMSQNEAQLLFRRAYWNHHVPAQLTNAQVVHSEEKGLGFFRQTVNKIEPASISHPRKPK